MWARPPGFATLVKIILEQQVSLSSAQAAFDRLQRRLHPVTLTGFLQLTDAELLAIGFSRQKARYVRALSAALVEGTLDLEALEGKDDDAVERDLLAIPGVGPWTVTIYQLMALRAAKSAGCAVPSDHIDRAVAYIKRCSVADGGGFGYQPGQGANNPRTGTGILVLEICGSHATPEAVAGAEHHPDQ